MRSPVVKAIRYGFGGGLLIGLLVVLGWVLQERDLAPPVRQSPIGQSIVNIDVYDTALNPARLTSFVRFPAVLATTIVKPDFQPPPTTDSLVPVYYRIPTQQPVVFLTIDDGSNKSWSGLQQIQEHGLTASLFLNDHIIKNNYAYFRQLQELGSVTENHTLHHPRLTELDYETQKREICANADKLGQVYRQRPTLLRPPYGLYNDQTRQVSHECGMKAIIMWSASINNGILTYRDSQQSLQPGDIVLMHFRPEMVKDLQAFIQAAQNANLHVALLEDWLK